MRCSLRATWLGLAVCAGCKEPADSYASDAAPAPSVVLAAPAPSAPPDAGSHAARCDATVLQPGSCLPFGALRAKALDEWASQHGVKSVQFGERGVESCEEVLVGLPDERALACMVAEAKPFEAAGLDGPTQLLYSLVIAEPSRGRLVTLVDLPIGVADSDVLFHASWKVDAATRQVTLDVPPADCAAAPESTRAYWKRQPGVPARVQQIASASDAKRIATLCKGVGTHPLAPRPPG